MTISHSNTFNLIRFLAATLVWYGHCYILTGLPDPLLQITSGMSLGVLSVSVFFVISGYFVTASYDNQGHWLPYIKNRLLRILPAVMVVILLGVFLLGPFTTSLTLHEYFAHPQTWRYFRAALWVFPMKYDLPGVFTDLPVPLVNGSLWTLHPEFQLYCELAVCGIVGLLRPRFALLILATLWSCRLYVVLAEDNLFPHIPLFNRWNSASMELLLHWSILFASGGLMYLARNHIPLKKEWFAVCFIILIIASQIRFAIGAMLFDLALPYTIIYLGFLSLPRLQVFKNQDFSYGIYLYAYPVQQLILHFWKNIPFAAFMAISFVVTFLCAAFSWYCIEQPALRLKRKSATRIINSPPARQTIPSPS